MVIVVEIKDDCLVFYYYKIMFNDEFVNFCVRQNLYRIVSMCNSIKFNAIIFHGYGNTLFHFEHRVF